MSKLFPAVYDYYKRDQYVTSGTAKELAEFMGVKVKTVRFMSKPAYKRRHNPQKSKMIYRVTDMEDDE